jgi:hypothetical protein
MMHPIPRCFGAVALFGSLVFSGCSTKISHRAKFPTGYVADATYVTKIDLPAVVPKGVIPSNARGVEFLRYKMENDTGGQIVVIGAGTRILIQDVTCEDDPTLGFLVRIYAKVTSGPYIDSWANIYGISIREKRPDGRMGLLRRDPAILEDLN